MKRIGLTLALFTLAACGTATSVSTTATSTTVAGSTTSTTATSAATTTTGGEVTFQGFTAVKSGGVAGLYRVLAIGSGGEIGRSDSPTKDPAATGERVAAADLARLKTLVIGPQWAALDDRYGQRAADGFNYTLSATPGKTVEVSEPASLPSLLVEVIGIVDRYFGP